MGRMKMLEDGFSHKISGKGKAMAKNEKYQGISEVSEYPVAADSTLESSSKRKFDEDFEEKPKKIKVEEVAEAVESVDGEKKKMKKKKKKVEKRRKRKKRKISKKKLNRFI